MSFVFSFLESLGSTLGVGTGTLITFLLSAGAGIILIVNWEFFFRFVLAIGNWIVFQLSKIPIFANGTYLSMIRRYKSAIKDTRELQKEIEGQKLELLEDYRKNEIEYNKAISRASYLKSSGNEDEALFFAKKALKLQTENKQIEEVDIPNLESASKAADKKIARLHDEIYSLKHDRKAINRTRDTAKVLEKSNRTLIGDKTEADEQILENYREHINDLRIKAQGSEAILATLPTEKLKSLDDKILTQQAEEFLNSL